MTKTIPLSWQQKKKFCSLQKMSIKKKQKPFSLFAVWTKDDKRDIEKKNERSKGINSFHVYLPKMIQRLSETPLSFWNGNKKPFFIETRFILFFIWLIWFLQVGSVIHFHWSYHELESFYTCLFTSNVVN